MSLIPGVCGICGKDISPGAIGYCAPCAREVHRKIDEEFPFEVVDVEGCHLESFRTEKEANDFLDKMRHCEVRKKEEC